MRDRVVSQRVLLLVCNAAVLAWEVVHLHVVRGAAAVWAALGLRLRAPCVPRAGYLQRTCGAATAGLSPCCLALSTRAAAAATAAAAAARAAPTAAAEHGCCSTWGSHSTLLRRSKAAPAATVKFRRGREAPAPPTLPRGCCALLPCGAALMETAVLVDNLTPPQRSTRPLECGVQFCCCSSACLPLR